MLALNLEEGRWKGRRRIFRVSLQALDWGLWITGLPSCVLIPAPGVQTLSVYEVSWSMGAVAATDVGYREEAFVAKPSSLSREGFDYSYGSLLRK